MHDVRNGLAAIQGLTLAIAGKGTPQEQMIREQIQRITGAIDKCARYKTGCGQCAYGSKLAEVKVHKRTA